jgi:hypothetical protein
MSKSFYQWEILNQITELLGMANEKIAACGSAYSERAYRWFCKNEQ